MLLAQPIGHFDQRADLGHDFLLAERPREVNIRAHVQPLQARFGVEVSPWPMTTSELVLAGLVLAAGLVAALLPAIHALRLSLSDGLTLRL